MARKKAKAVAKKTKSKAGKPTRGEMRLAAAKQEKKELREKRRAAMQAAKSVRKKKVTSKAKSSAASEKQLEFLCDTVAELGVAVKELHVDVRPIFQLANDLKKHVDDLRYRMEQAEQRIAKGAGTSLMEFPAHELARVLASRLQAEEQQVAQ